MDGNPTTKPPRSNKNPWRWIETPTHICPVAESVAMRAGVVTFCRLGRNSCCWLSSVAAVGREVAVINRVGRWGAHVPNTCQYTEHTNARAHKLRGSQERARKQTLEYTHPHTNTHPHTPTHPPTHTPTHPTMLARPPASTHARPPARACTHECRQARKRADTGTQALRHAQARRFAQAFARWQVR